MAYKKSEQTKEKILLCAEKVFSAKGYYEAQISDIARLAKIAKGTIYQYFESKEALFVFLIERYVEEGERYVSLSLDDFLGDVNPQESAHKYLHHRIEKTMIFFSENQDRANIVLRVGLGLRDDIESAIKIFENKIMEAIIRDIKIGQRFGHISKNLNIELAGNAILGGILRISYFYFVLKQETFGFGNEVEFQVVSLRLSLMMVYPLIFLSRS